MCHIWQHCAAWYCLFPFPSCPRSVHKSKLYNGVFDIRAWQWLLISSRRRRGRRRRTVEYRRNSPHHQPTNHRPSKRQFFLSREKARGNGCVYCKLMGSEFRKMERRGRERLERRMERYHYFFCKGKDISSSFMDVKMYFGHFSKCEIEYAEEAFRSRYLLWFSFCFVWMEMYESLLG